VASEDMIGRMFALLGEVWPKEAANISPTTVEVYSRILADIDDDLLKAGVVKLLSEATFWPKPAEIRRACLDLVAPANRTAGEAWAMVVRYRDMAHSTWIGGKRWIRKPLPDDVQRAVDAIGGMTYLERVADNDTADRARFLQAYEQLAAREQERARMLPEVRAIIEQVTASKRLQRRDTARIEAGEAV
jgi:hypothetical protein